MLKAQAKPVDYEKAIALAKGMAPDKPVVRLSQYGVRKVWDNYEVITDVYISDTKFIRIAAGTIDGYRKVNLREFYYSKRDCEWKPGQSGFLIPMVAPIFTGESDVPTFKEIGKEFLDGLITATNTAQTMELADPDKAMYILRNYTKSTIIKAKETTNE